MNDNEILEYLELILIRLKDVKKYIKEQKKTCEEKNEMHGFLVLNYLDRIMLDFVKDKDRWECPKCDNENEEEMKVHKKEKITPLTHTCKMGKKKIITKHAHNTV